MLRGFLQRVDEWEVTYEAKAPRECAPPGNPQIEAIKLLRNRNIPCPINRLCGRRNARILLPIFTRVDVLQVPDRLVAGRAASIYSLGDRSLCGSQNPKPAAAAPNKKNFTEFE